MTDEPLQQRTRRKRVTRRSARIAERVAKTLISIGGIGTILAVTVICVFLVWVVVPLFLPATMSEPRRVATEHAAGQAKPLALGVDEYRVLGWVAFDDGSLCAFRLDDGSLLERRELVGGARPTAMSFGHDGGVVCGFDDGSIRVGQVGVSTRFLERDAMPEDLRDLAAGKLAVHDGAVAQRTPEGQFRLQGLSVEFDPAIPAVHPVRIDLIDHVRTASTRTIAALYADGRLSMFGVRQKTNLLTAETTYELSEGVLPFVASAEHGAPQHLLLNGGASSAFLAWNDGHLERYDTRSLDDARLAERVDVVDDPKAELDVFGMLLGRNSLVTGDSKGRVSVWFTTKPHQADSSDGALLSKVHELVGNGAAATAIGPSERTRLLAVGYADGAVRVFHATSATQVVAVNGPPGGESVLAVAIAPKEDGVVALTASGLWSVDLDPGHPEVSVAAIFRPVWYEGYPGPEHVWQSSSGTDDFEPKLGVMPLVFGTLKATLYSMLFGVPLAILAAIYSSEFLNPRLRVPIKSTIEIMASLPSVVLGFLAALVIAPYVQDVVPAVLCAFVTIPVALLAGARAWQLLPQRLALRWADLQRFGFICLALPLGVLAAVACGPLVERALFAGDLKLWLDGQVGGPIGGWMILFLPLSALAVAVFMTRAVDPWIRRMSPDWNRAKCARVDLVRFAAGAVLVLIVSLAVSAVFGAMGWDARGSYLDTYQQRNALVVGFVMGFAIIPIIYTLAEDALASVPSHLRLASLGCGATPWQTAMRVIVPTAMSGLFSAVMIGLGRAVGETMIVLMATGNTPVMSWNMFSGFRTLSANIAVELPEAVKNSTHYRMLFLAALTLFAITFAVNTAAEIVRQRFRKRAYQL